MKRLFIALLLAFTLMAQTTTTLATNLTVSAPGSTAPLTISGDTSTVQYNASVLCPLDTNARFSFVLEKSSDGGASYFTFVGANYSGGPITKGPNAGLQATNVFLGEIVNLKTGDKIRARVVSIINGTGSWVVTNASITQF